MEAVSIALEPVRDYLIKDVTLIGGVSRQVEEIKHDLIWVKDFLKDIDRSKQKDDSIRSFENQFRQLAYRVEDVLETYSIKVQSHNEGDGLQNTLKRLSCIFREGIARHEVGSELEDIKTNLNTLVTKMKDVQEIMHNRNKQGQSSAQNENCWRETYPHQVEEYFVGMKDHISQLVPKFTDKRTNEKGYRFRGIISIYGMGGLGKTTLAKQIYNNNDVRSCFQATAWVSVTQQFDRRNIFATILKQIVANPMEEEKLTKCYKNMEERELIDVLHKVQKEKRCLVVLDDLWKIDDWTLLSPAFPLAEANSKILVTTRNEELAKEIGGFPYPLPFLSKDDGWDLLQKKAFSRNDKDSEIDRVPFEAIGREIVRKCGDLPLAISVIGGILSRKSSLPEWQTVNKDVDFYLRRADSSKQEYGIVLQVLALSYDELPYYLKPCFLYLGNFHEDDEIDPEKLYQMWIAEGMVSPDHGGREDTLTDVAERYLLEMSARSMVQLEFRAFSTRRTVRKCQLDDLMRDFCLTRAKEVDFHEFLAVQEGNIPSPPLDPSKPYRYSILIESVGEGPSSHNYGNDAMMNASLPSIGKPLRSLSVIYRSYPDLEISFPELIYQSKNFKSLRVLRFERCRFKGNTLPRGIKKLIHLRYLSFESCYGLTKLPSSIGQLQYLQTLQIDVDEVLEVPNVLWKLKRLRYLFLASPFLETTVRVKGKGKGRGKGKGKGKKEGKLCLSGLSNLEEFRGFNSEYCEFGDLWEMINLRALVGQIHIIREDDIVEIALPILNYLNSNDHKLRYAEIVVISNGTDVVVPLKELLGCRMVNAWYIFFGKCEFQKLEPPYPCSNLVVLTLGSVEIEGDPMDCLGNLPNLQKLCFQGVRLVEKVMVCGANSFPELESLEIWWVENLEDWIVSQGGLSKLSQLSIRCCRALKMIPDGLKSVVTLRQLEIIEMPSVFKEEILGKLGHVPTIIYRD